MTCCTFPLFSFSLMSAQPVVRLFNYDPGVVALRVSCLRIMSYGALGNAYFMEAIQVFYGCGRPILPKILRFLDLEIPLAYVSGDAAGKRSNGVFASIAIAESSMALASAIFLRQRNGKRKN
jgi:Na+-driven multidrug efflux pump